MANTSAVEKHQVIMVLVALLSELCKPGVAVTAFEQSFEVGVELDWEYRARGQAFKRPDGTQTVNFKLTYYEKGGF